MGRRGLSLLRPLLKLDMCHTTVLMRWSSKSSSKPKIKGKEVYNEEMYFSQTPGRIARVGREKLIVNN